MNYLVLGNIALIAMSISTSAGATEFFEERGGWNVFSGEDSCGMAMEYEGQGSTTLIFIKFFDDKTAMSVTNSYWTAEDGVKYDIEYIINGETFGGGSTVGTKRSTSAGFVSRFGSDFEMSFRKGATLHIYLRDVRIDQLSLSGTSVALDSLNRCARLQKIEQAKVQKEVDRLSHIPKDPFALVKGATDAKPRGTPNSCVSMNDYPPQALREERLGRVRFTLTISPAGMVTNCSVIASSGHADLDEATCTLIRRRARFQPATNSEGLPIEGSWSSTVRWSIPIFNR